RRVRDAEPRFSVDAQAHRRLVERFAATLLDPDNQAFAELLAEDISWVADGGGQAVAASRVLHGVRASVRLATGIARRAAGQWHTRVAWINGEPGVLVLHGEHIHAAMTLVSDGQRVRRIYSMVNPHKLGRLEEHPGD